MASCPDFEHDLNLAIRLPLDKDMYYSLEAPGERAGARCEVWNQSPRSTERLQLIESTAEADTPALAVCRAWLSWKRQETEEIDG